jgi:genome maintenance exonuclease 1
MFNHVSHNFPQLIQENVDGVRRYVTPTGEKYASVTTVLADYGKEGIMEWRKRVGEEKANKISRAATTRGTSVHSVIEKYLKNEDVSDVEMMPNVKSLFVRMKEELKKIDNIHCLEDRLYSHTLKLAGTVDCIAEHNGVLSVIDFKTSVRLKKKENIGNYFMQCAAYAQMFTEMTSLPITQVIVLIGVDTANFCQTLKISGEELNNYKNMLQTYIDAYYAKVA